MFEELSFKNIEDRQFKNRSRYINNYRIKSASLDDPYS